nr:T9SS type A sorting domain-containing protein [Bacteroidota bacterium]
ANPLQFPADKLTSRPIRLDSIFEPVARKLSPADSVYFSFYYQPQGRGTGGGNDPQKQDSLVLEFGWFTIDSVFSYIDSIQVLVGIYPVDTVFPGDILFSPCDTAWGTVITDTLYPLDYVTLPCDSVFIPETNWSHIWSSEGFTLDTFRMFNDTAYFRQVMIPITDTNFFRDDFQFRFFNYASIASDNLQSWQSNCDYWNVDYILLDAGRSRLDTTHKAITFVERPPSFIKEFERMPFPQYRDDPTSSIKSGFEMYMSNLDNVTQLATYTYEVTNDAGGFIYEYNGGDWTMEVFNNFGFITHSPWAYPAVDEFFPPYGDRDTAYFDITHYLIGQVEQGFTDTVAFRQEFSNYYAYDDGSPEFGYGLTPAGSMLAYQFSLNTRDTLRALNMYFNKTLTGANQQFFDIAVWSDLNGAPGDIIYLQERVKPVFSDNLYQFHTYELDSAVPLSGSSPFYVGWIQSTNHNLNVGFDTYNNAGSHIFYNVAGEWIKTSYQGSLMIRPVIGKKLTENNVIKSTLVDAFIIAPNPTQTGLIEFKFLDRNNITSTPSFVIPDEQLTDQMEIEVFNLLGQRLYYSSYQQIINLSFLNRGVYVVRLIDNFNQKTLVEKMVMAK